MPRDPNRRIVSAVPRLASLRFVSKQADEIRLRTADQRAASPLALALEHSDTRTEAAEAIRGLIDAIVLTPAEGAPEADVVRRDRRAQVQTGGAESGIQIGLKGNLAAMLSAAQKATRSRKPATSNCR